MDPLYDLFIEKVKQSFAYLESEYSLSRTEESRRWLAQVTYSGSLLKVEVRYGDRDLYINTLVGLPSETSETVSMYGLWEWLQALGINESRSTGDNLVLSSERIAEVVSQSAAVLRDHLDEILPPPADTIRRMETAREKAKREFEERYKSAK